MQYKKFDLEINLSFILGMIIMGIGVWLVSRISLNTNRLHQNSTYIPYLSRRREPLLHETSAKSQEELHDFIKMRSFASSRFIAAFLSIANALVNLVLFGMDFTGENHVGSWFALGGPSLFYPLSVLPLVFAVGLTVYAIFSSAIITFSKSEHFYFIEEHRFLAPWMTEIPRDEVRAVRISNAHTGARYIWILVLGIQIIWLYIDGFAFLLNPFAFGAGIAAGVYYLVSATIQTVVLCILVLKHQTFLEIITDDNRYELQFSPPAIIPQLRGSIERFFEIPALNEKNRKFQQYRPELDQNTQNDSKLPRRLIKDYRNLFVGTIFFLVAIISEKYGTYAGEPLRMALYMFGFLLLIKGFKEDFSSPRHKFGVIYDQANKQLYFRKEWAWYNSVYRVVNCEPQDYNYEPRVLKLGFFEVMMGITISVLVGMDFASIFTFLPNDDLLTGMKAIHVVMGIFLLALVAYILIRPLNTLHIHTKALDFEYPIPGTLTESQLALNKETPLYLHSLLIWKAVIKGQPKAVAFRLLGIMVALIVGINLFFNILSFLTA